MKIKACICCPNCDAVEARYHLYMDTFGVITVICDECDNDVFTFNSYALKDAEGEENEGKI